MRRVVVEMTLDGVPDEVHDTQVLTAMVNALYEAKLAQACHWSVSSEDSKLEGLSVRT